MDKRSKRYPMLFLFLSLPLYFDYLAYSLLIM